MKITVLYLYAYELKLTFKLQLIIFTRFGRERVGNAQFELKKFTSLESIQPSICPVWKNEIKFTKLSDDIDLGP